MSDQEVHKKADTKFQDAYTASRSMIFYNSTATVPLLVITGVLLFTKIRGTFLYMLSILGAITSLIGMFRLLSDLTKDIAGYPDFKLPIWAVFYLIVYIISFFAFLFFSMHIKFPHYYFSGISHDNERVAFVDMLYMSMCDYIGITPDGISAIRQSSRFLNVIHGLLSMFVNAVIITKFVNAF
jgi:hypothetical protein